MESAFWVNCPSLQRRLRDLQAENERLRRQLDAALRAGAGREGAATGGAVVGKIVAILLARG